jgi:anti-sigma regulatory factor (Ser/Thr protein kinase)
MGVGFRLPIDGQGDAVARAATAFADFSAEHDVPAEVRRSVQVVLDDLLANVVSHGLAGRADGVATLEVALATDELVITLSDNGPPFDPFQRAAPDTSLSIEERPIGGLGIHLVRHMVDEATYHRRGDQNVTVITKRWTNATSSGHSGGE